MAIGAQDEYRPAAPGPIEFRQRAITTALVLVQAVAEKPTVLIEARAHRFDARKQRLAGLNVGGTHVLPAGHSGRVAVRMAVGIDDPGYRSAPIEIDDTCARPLEGPQAGELAGCDYVTVARRQRGYEALLFIERRDIGVFEDQIGVQCAHLWLNP